MVTAVQWLKTYIEFKRHANLLTYSSIEEALEEALRMEKDQIMKAFSNGQELPISNPLLPHYSSEEYYNETYQNEKKD